MYGGESVDVIESGNGYRLLGVSSAVTRSAVPSICLASAGSSGWAFTDLALLVLASSVLFIPVRLPPLYMGGCIREGVYLLLEFGVLASGRL